MAQDWYCRISGQQVGPLTATKLKKLADSGNLQGDDEVRLDADGKWVAARKVKGLFTQTPTAPQEPPPSPDIEVYGIRGQDADSSASPVPTPVDAATTRYPCDTIPESVARENRVFPLKIKEDVLTIAASNPDHDVIDKLRFILNRDIEVIETPEPEIQKLIDQYYKTEPDNFTSDFPPWMQPFS